MTLFWSSTFLHHFVPVPIIVGTLQNEKLFFQFEFFFVKPLHLHLRNSSEQVTEQATWSFLMDETDMTSQAGNFAVRMEDFKTRGWLHEKVVNFNYS